MTRELDGSSRTRTVALVAVALAAAGYFALGIRLALGWALGWIDSGLVVYGSWRVAQGGVPYRDFDHVYGPSLFYLNAALLRLFGADLAVVVWSLLVLKVGLAVLVFALARRVADVVVAGALTALLVVVWGAPLWLFGAPYAQHYGTACALIALLVASGGGRRRLVLAGLWVGVAATFKITSGLFALMALVVWALDDRTPATGGTAASGVVRIGTVLGVLALGVLYAIGSLPAAADVASILTVVVVAVPFTAVVATALRGPVAARAPIDVLLVAVAAAVPLLVWLVVFAAQGAGGALLRDLLSLPPTLHWFEPLRAPSMLAAGVVVATVLAAAGATRLAVAATIGALVFVRGGSLGGVGFDVVGWLPIVAVLVALPLVRGMPPVPRLYVLFAATNLLLLLPAADVWHLFWILPTALPLVAALLVARPRARLALAVLAVAAVPFVVQLVTARESWRGATARFARASGITHPDPKFDDVAALVRTLDAEPARSRPLLILTAEAMIYFLAGRESAFEHEEYLMQTLVRGAASPESTALLTDDADFARRLETARPLLVDEPGESVRERLRRFLPKTAAVLDAYQPRETFGRYAILDR